MHNTLPSRRSFLTTVGAAVLGSRSLPRWRAVTVMGLGGVGAAVARDLARGSIGAEYWLWDAAPQPAGIGVRSAVVPYNVLTDRRANIVVPKTVNDALGAVEPAAITQQVILIAALGGVAGSGILPPLASLLEGRDHALTLYASLPWRVHGAPWRPDLVRHALAECAGVEMRTVVVNGRLTARQALGTLIRTEL